MNIEKVKMSRFYVPCLAVLALGFANPGNCQQTGTVVNQLNTSASSEATSEASSEASWAAGFPLERLGTSLWTPAGVYYMPMSSPNPAYKIQQEQNLPKTRQHEVKALVRNYSWPMSGKRLAAAHKTVL